MNHPIGWFFYAQNRYGFGRKLITIEKKLAENGAKWVEME
jgi:hypothetical protein